MPMTQVKLAAALGVSPARVCQLKRQGMPADDLEAALEWRRRNVAPHARSSTPPAEPAVASAGTAPPGPLLDLAQERAQLAKAQREAVEIKNAVLRGTYAPITLLAQVLAGASAAVADHLDALPGQLRKTCPGLTPAAIERVQQTVALARNEWVRQTHELVAARVLAVPGADEEDADEGEAAP